MTALLAMKESFGEKCSVPQLLSLLWLATEGRQNPSCIAPRELQAKAEKKCNPTQKPRQSSPRALAKNVRDLLRKELKKFIRTHLEVYFLETTEEAIGWAKEDEKSRGQHPRYTRPAPSLSPLPLSQAWIRWLKPCKVSKELFKIWQPIKTLTGRGQNVQP